MAIPFDNKNYAVYFGSMQELNFKNAIPIKKCKNGEAGIILTPEAPHNQDWDLFENKKDLIKNYEIKPKIMNNSFFVTEFNKRRRDYLWDKHEEKMKSNFFAALIQLEAMIVTYPDKSCENQMNGWDKNTCGYRGVGFNNGFVSKVATKASLVNGVKTVNDHFVGTSLCGETVRKAFIENDYN